MLGDQKRQNRHNRGGEKMTEYACKHVEILVGLAKFYGIIDEEVKK